MKLFNIINLTKHPVHIMDASEKIIRSIDCGNAVARVIGATKTKKIHQHMNIDMYELIDGNKIINLPDPKPHCIYIVSRIVLEKVSMHRDDVYAPLMQYSVRQKRNICIGLYRLKDKQEVLQHELLSNTFF